MWLGGSDVMDDTNFFVDNGIRAVVSICDTHPSMEVIKTAKLSVIHVNVQDAQTTNLMPYFARIAHFIQAARTGHLRETNGQLEELDGEIFYNYSPHGISTVDVERASKDLGTESKQIVETKTNSMGTKESISEAKAKLEESLEPLYRHCFVRHQERLVEGEVKTINRRCCFCLMTKEDVVEPSKSAIKGISDEACNCGQQVCITSSKLIEKRKVDQSVSGGTNSTLGNKMVRKLCADGELIHPTGVYIHCQAGISRSTTTFCSYLIVWLGFSVKMALGHLHRCRDCICPNQGFREQLSVFEQRKEFIAMLNKSITEKFGENSELLEKDLNHVAFVMSQTAEKSDENEDENLWKFRTVGTEEDFEEQERLLREQLRHRIKDVEEGKISQNVGLQWLFSNEDKPNKQ